MDAEVWPLQRTPGVARVIDGELLMLVVEPSAANDAGSCVQTWMNGLSDVKADEKFSGWRSALLTPGMSLWVPYGWLCIPIALSSQRPVVIDPDCDKVALQKVAKRAGKKKAEQQQVTSIRANTRRKA